MVDRGTLHASRRNAILEASGDTAYSTACRRRRDRAEPYGSHVGGPTCHQVGPCSDRAQAAEWEGPHGRSAAFRSAGERRQPAPGKKRAPASRPRRRENEHPRPQRAASSAASRRGRLHRRASARRLGLTPLGAQSLTLTGGRLFRFRLGEGRQVADAVRALEAEKLGTAQPNYVYSLQQNATSAPTLPAGDAAQYAVSKLRLRDVHRWSVGKDVPVAVIDSQIDAAHPDLAGAFGEQFDAVGKTDRADNHGTGMTGA